jgi:hypothetical protein
MKRIVLCALLGAMTGTAGATFELRDPANEVFEEKKPPSEETETRMGDTACFDFLHAKIEQSGVYADSLNWVARASGATDRDQLAEWLERYCIDHPKAPLGEAATTYVGQGD